MTSAVMCVPPIGNPRAEHNLDRRCGTAEPRNKTPFATHLETSHEQSAPGEIKTGTLVKGRKQKQLVDGSRKGPWTNPPCLAQIGCICGLAN